MALSKFNAISYSAKLKRAGLEQKIADIHAEEICNIINNDIATKEDLYSLKTDINKDIAHMNQEVINIKNEMVIKLGSIVIGCTFIISIMIGVLGFVMKP